VIFRICFFKRVNLCRYAAGKWLEGFGIAVASRRAPRQPRVWGPKRAQLQKMKKRG
jgi:hypothetical protein